MEPDDSDGREDDTVPKHGGYREAAWTWVAVTIEWMTWFSGTAVTMMVVEAIGEADGQVATWSKRWRRSRTVWFLGAVTA
jgi:hypothetical protein